MGSTLIDQIGMQNIVTIIGFILLLSWETFRPFFPFYRGRLQLRGLHLGRNISLGLLNTVLIGVGSLWLWGWTADGSAALGFGLLHRWPMPMGLHALLAILLLDLFTYGWHRANHRIPFLWRFHRMHHSDPWMDVSSARRFHPGEILFSSLLRLPFLFLLGIQVWELLLYSWLMGFVVDFHHANIALPEKIDRYLRILIATPAMHKVHHSQIHVETDSNYSSMLTVWDRIFGSFRLRADLAGIEIGLKKWNADANQTISRMLATPWSHPRP